MDELNGEVEIRGSKLNQNELLKDSSTTTFWQQALVPSLQSLLLTCFFILTLLMNGSFNPRTKRGFFCDDSSINYPYKPDTVGTKTLFFFGLILPSLVIRFCDKRLVKLLRNPTYSSIIRNHKKFNHPRRKRRKVSDVERTGRKDEIDCEEEELISCSDNIKRRNNTCNDKGDESDEEINLFTRVPLDYNNDDDGDDDDDDVDEEAGCDSNTNYSDRAPELPAIFKRNFSEFQLFFFGVCSTMFLTGVGKLVSGRLRPHFLQMCRPNVDCSLEKNLHRYIEDYTCQNDSIPRGFAYITTSWPSGHASMIFYSMFYLIIYLNSVIPILLNSCSERIRKRYNPLATYSLYVLMVGLALFIAMSRVSDYHHHPLDVLSGSILGFSMAIGLSLFHSKAHYYLRIAEYNFRF